MNQRERLWLWLHESCSHFAHSRTREHTTVHDGSIFSNFNNYFVKGEEERFSTICCRFSSEIQRENKEIKNNLSLKKEEEARWWTVIIAVYSNCQCGSVERRHAQFDLSDPGVRTLVQCWNQNFTVSERKFTEICGLCASSLNHGSMVLESIRLFDLPKDASIDKNW